MNKKEESQKRSNLYELLGDLDDPRRGQGKRHSLAIILIIVIMTVMSGETKQRGMADFAKRHKKEIVKELKIPKKIVPSRATIGRVLRKINFDQLSEIFYQWTIQRIDVKKGSWCSLDGKAIKGTVTNGCDSTQSFVSLVSLFLSKEKQVLSTGKINNKKESEIPMVRKLIKMLDLEGVIFTIDALHCQSETAKIIVESNNDYVLSAKENQPKLLQQLKKTL